MSTDTPAFPFSSRDKVPRAHPSRPPSPSRSSQPRSCSRGSFRPHAEGSNIDESPETTGSELHGLALTDPPLVPVNETSSLTWSEGTRGTTLPRSPLRNSTSPYRDIVFRVRERFDLLRPASSASSVSEPGLSRAISSRRCLVCSDSNFAKLSIEVNHTLGSPLARTCSPRAIARVARLHLVVASDADLQCLHGIDL